MRLTINHTVLFFDVDGAALVPAGPTMREKPTMLFLHGGPGFDHAYFKPALEDLTDLAQLIYLDQRSQGRSGKAPIATCTIEQMADDAVALCRALDITRPVILGHSYGGFVALHMALRHPDVAGALILVDSATSTTDMAGAMERLEARYGEEVRVAAVPVFTGAFTEAEAEAFQRLVAPTYVADPAKLPVVAEAWGRSAFSPEVASHYFRELASRYDIRDRLPDIQVPTLVVVGEHDWLLPPQASQVIAAGIPGAELVMLPQAGHFSFIERRQEFVDVVRRFLGKAAEGQTTGIG